MGGRKDPQQKKIRSEEENSDSTSDNSEDLSSPGEEEAKSDQEETEDQKIAAGRTYGEEDCNICGTSFEKTATNQKYCLSPPCRAEIHRLRKLQKKAYSKKSTAAKNSPAAKSKVSGKRKMDTTRPASPPSSRSSRNLAPSVPSAKAKKKKSRSTKDGYTHTSEPKPDLVVDKFVTNYTRTPAPTAEEVHGKSDRHLPWGEIIRQLQARGYVIIDLQSNNLAGNPKMHCELMEQKEPGLWRSCVRQGWESGKRFKLADIREDEYKMDNVQCCKDFIQYAQSIMSKISGMLWQQMQEYEVAYLSREPGKFKQEFVHADSLYQGDLTGIMPLNEDSVQPSFAPYDKIASVPITRNDKEFQDKNIRGIYQKIQIRFQLLTNTVDGAATLYESMRPTVKVNRGDLFLHLGDALHARPAIDMTKQDRWICIKGRLLADLPADSQQTKHSPDHVPGLPDKSAGNKKEAVHDDSSVTPKDDSNKSTVNKESSPDDAKKPAAVDPSPVEPPNPDSHGVVDALVVLKYAPPDVKEDAAIHHLLAAGYTDPDGAAKFHKTRYQDADSNQQKKFKDRFIELLHKKEKSVRLDDSLLPTHFSDFGWP